MSRLPRHTTVFARAHTHIRVFAAARTFADLRTFLIDSCVRRRRCHCTARNRRRQWFIGRSCKSAGRLRWIRRRRRLEFAADDHHGHVALRTSRDQLFDDPAIEWWSVTRAVVNRGWKSSVRNQSFAVRFPLRHRINSGKLHFHGASSRFIATKSHPPIQSHGHYCGSCHHHRVTAERDAEYGVQLSDPNG